MASLTITLTPEQLRALERIAARESRQVTDLLVESVDRLIRARPEPMNEEERRAAWERASALVGAFAFGRPDAARNHDELFVESVMDA